MTPQGKLADVLKGQLLLDYLQTLTILVEQIVNLPDKEDKADNLAAIFSHHTKTLLPSKSTAKMLECRVSSRSMMMPQCEWLLKSSVTRKVIILFICTPSYISAVGAFQCQMFLFYPTRVPVCLSIEV